MIPKFDTNDILLGLNMDEIVMRNYMRSLARTFTSPTITMSSFNPLFLELLLVKYNNSPVVPPNNIFDQLIKAIGTAEEIHKHLIKSRDETTTFAPIESGLPYEIGLPYEVNLEDFPSITFKKIQDFFGKDKVRPIQRGDYLYDRYVEFQGSDNIPFVFVVKIGREEILKLWGYRANPPLDAEYELYIA